MFGDVSGEMPLAHVKIDYRLKPLRKSFEPSTYLTYKHKAYLYIGFSFVILFSLPNLNI